MAKETTGGVSRRRFLASTGVVGGALVGGCVENVQEDPAADELETVVVTGSSTVYPITDTVAQRFMEEREVNVTVDSTGSGGGFENHFCPGNSAINGSSRPIKDQERQACADNGVEPVEFQVAGDALTVAVNNDFEEIECVSFEQLSQIWREDGAERWSDVNEEWPDEEIELFGPAPTSGTYDWFNENVVGEEYNHTADHEQTENDNDLIKGVEDNEFAIGYFGYAYYIENDDRVKALEIESPDGECTEPTLENAADGSYPMARPLYVYASRDELGREEVFDFLAFYLENASTDLVGDVGYVPIDEETRDENLARLVRSRP